LFVRILADSIGRIDLYSKNIECSARRVMDMGHSLNHVKDEPWSSHACPVMTRCWLVYVVTQCHCLATKVDIHKMNMFICIYRHIYIYIYTCLYVHIHLSLSLSLSLSLYLFIYASVLFHLGIPAVQKMPVTIGGPLGGPWTRKDPYGMGP
jgi:hypothetical protein